jgi:RNA-binding protein
MSGMQLTELQKKFLRREAHSLKPVIAVGDKGITQALLAEVESAIDHHELIKIRVRASDREQRDAAIETIIVASQASLVSRIGNVAAIYRPRKKKPGIVLPV